jgi:cell division septal protein FtsQ
MSVQIETTERFLRPIDVDRVRRNYRRMQMQRLMAVALNAVVIVAVMATAIALYRRAQSDARFAVRHVEITGALHTTRADLERVARPYIGMNLFTLDIARIHRDIASLAWVSRIEIEKSLPDTLRIRVVERTPAALTEDGGRMAYVDENGTAFAALSPSIGDADLPLITGARGAELAGCVALLRKLRAADPDLYARISEMRPLPPHGVVFFDRQLQAPVYANEEGLSAKWRDLHAVARAEHFSGGEIAYADLRFRGRVVIKPLRAMPAAAFAPRTVVPLEITN